MTNPAIYKKSAIHYWERRRIFYNLALLPPSFVGFGLGDAANWAGNPVLPDVAYVLRLFAASAVGANICYSFAYTLEFLLSTDDSTSRWLRFGRTMVFVLGVLFAMLLAFFGGANIADMDYHHWVYVHSGGK
jgi:hypothetical protein